MKKRLSVILGLLMIIGAIFIVIDNWDIAVTYVEFDADQSELLDTYVQNELPSNEEVEEMMTQNTYIPDLDIDFDELQKINPDIVGWIYIPGTQTNYPILIGDNDSQYLHRNYKNNYQYLGSIYAHYRTSPLLDDPYTVLFGHNMKSGRMFGDLSYYAKQSFRDKYPFVYIYTPAKNMQCTVYASTTVNASDESIYRYGYEYATEEYRKLIDYTVTKSSINCSIAPTENDQIFCLSTCTDGGRSTQRFVVHCVVTYTQYLQ